MAASAPLLADWGQTMKSLKRPDGKSDDPILLVKNYTVVKGCLTNEYQFAEGSSAIYQRYLSFIFFLFRPPYAVVVKKSEPRTAEASLVFGEKND